MFDKYAICSSCYIYPQLNIMHLEIKYTYNMNIFFICKTYAHQSKKTLLDCFVGTFPATPTTCIK